EANYLRSVPHLKSRDDSSLFSVSSNVKDILSEVADALKRLWTHARGLVGCRARFPSDKGTLDRAPTPHGPVCSVSVPDRSMKNDHRSWWAARQYLPAIGAGRAIRGVGLAGPQVGTRHEPRVIVH